MFRFHAVASLIAVIVAAGVLFFLVRAVAINRVIELAESSNLALARTALTWVKPDLVDFLAAVSNVSPQPQATDIPPLPAGLAAAINDMLGIPAVVRVKIFNLNGVVVFSNKHDQIGTSYERNGGFESAMKGTPVSSLRYRDAFNPFGQAAEDDSLIQTYVPVQLAPTEPLLGVMEIYTDANPLVARNERAQLYILVGLGAILGILYVALLVVARRAAGVIERQQQTIRERTATLEFLSAHMLSAEEEDKKSIALELHEGLAQTLCSIKVRLEDQLEHIAREGRDAAAVGPIIPVLQDAIEDVRELAGSLRPASLDELGLLPTIEWFCDSFERMHPGISVETSIAVGEDDTPLPLKIVLYRVIESTFRVIARHAGRNRVRLELRGAVDAIELRIEDTPRDSRYYIGAAPLRDAEQRLRFAKVKERITLSGGTFQIRNNAAGGTILHASWLRVSLEELAGGNISAARRAG